MKRLLIGITAVTSLLATSAFAADLPARTYTKAPVYVEPVYDWTGFYIGGNVGYSWGRSSDTSTLTNAAGTVLFTSSDKIGFERHRRRRSDRIQLADAELGVRP